MDVKQVDGGASFVATLDRGCDALAQIGDFFESKGYKSGFFTLIGAADGAELGFYRQRERTYERFVVDEECEIISCTGNVAEKDGKIFVHAHACLGKSDESTIAGHVFSLKIFAAEGYIRAFKAGMKREYDEETGLHLIRFG